MATDKKSGLSKLSIGNKLIIIFVSVSLFITLVLSVVSYITGSSAIRHEAINTLSAVAELKTDRIINFMDNRYGEVVMMSGLSVIKSKADNLINDIRNSTISANLSIKQKRELLRRTSENYRLLYQFLYKNYKALHHYSEIKIVAIFDITNKNGEVVFREGDQLMSVNDFAGNTKNRTMYKYGYELMMLRGKAVQSKKNNSPFLYSSSIEHCGELKKPSIHMSHGIGRYGLSMNQLRRNTPVAQRFSSMIIFDIETKSTNKIMNDKTGLGKTGETYIIQKLDGKLIMLTDSRFEKNTALKKDLSKVEGLQQHMNRSEFKRGKGLCQNRIYPDYRGINVLSHNHMIKMGNHSVGVITEINESEVFTAVRTLLIEMVILGIIVIIIAIVIAVFFSRTISNPLKYSVQIASTIAQGDLTVDIKDEYLKRGDEIGSMSSAMNQMVLDLRSVISSIIVAAQNLSQAVQQIASGNENLSQRTSEQASSLEEIASTIEEATATINQNSENSQNASKMANDSLQLANEGGTVVNESVNSINDINQSSKKINEIITVINEIAFQTNLLALNAAVEAARAGEQGRGFAVVAGEVRNLAQRSGNAAKEIELLIKDSIDKVDRGTELANKSGEALQEIIKGISDVNKVIMEIAASSNEQKQGINQINIAITEMDQMTQNNASLVEETASASEEMANQAQELMGMVEKFKVKEGDSSSSQGMKHLSFMDDKKGGQKKQGTTKTTVEKKQVKTGDAKPAEGDKLKQEMMNEGFEEF